MADKVIVVISDMDDPKRGEISVLDSPQKAARIVEALLEAGFEQERIRIFCGGEMEMQVRQRPVVALTGPHLPIDGEARADGNAPGASEPARGQPEERDLEEVATDSKAELEEAAVIPYVKDGVRFSSLFRPA